MSVFSDLDYFEQTSAVPVQPTRIRLRIRPDEPAVFEVDSVGGPAPASFTGEIPVFDFEPPIGVVSARISTPVVGHGYAHLEPGSLETGTTYLTTPTSTAGTVKLRIWAPGGDQASEFWTDFVKAWEQV